MLSNFKLQFTKEDIQRWAISTLITFGAGFILALYPQIDSINLDGLRDGTIVGILFVAVRAGIKAVFELAITYINTRRK